MSTKEFYSSKPDKFGKNRKKILKAQKIYSRTSSHFNTLSFRNISLFKNVLNGVAILFLTAIEKLKDR